MDRVDAIMLVNRITDKAKERCEIKQLENPDFPFAVGVSREQCGDYVVVATVALVSKPRSTNTTYRTTFKLSGLGTYEENHARVIGREKLIDQLSK